MKKRVLLLLPLFLGACSDSGESPVIKIEKLYAKVESEDEVPVPVKKTMRIRGTNCRP